MKIIVTGSSGLVGSALCPLLAASGHQIFRLVHLKPNGKPSSKVDGKHAFAWSPERKILDASDLEGMDAIIHLAGENIAGRWTKAKKERIMQSRVEGTRLLAAALATTKNPPKTWICASAIGYYGSCGNEILDEDSKRGSGFLAEVCAAWEAATEEASKKGIRVVQLRFGMILSAHGGALAKMLPPFKMGVGGIVGDGMQYMSWVTLEDVLAAIQFVLLNESLQGPVNVVSPSPSTNYEFTKALGKSLKRPTLLPMPGFVPRLIFGEMADALLLASTRVVPSKLQHAKFACAHATIDDALMHLITARSGQSA